MTTPSSDTEIHSPKNAAEQFAQRSQSPVQRIQHVLHGHPSISPLLVLIIASIVFTIINPRLASPANISLILQQVAVIAALAVGQTLIILTAGIDLSVGAITILAMLVMANLAANNGVPAVLALIIGFAVGTLCGWLNGALITRLKLPPFIATLGTLSIFTALGLLYSGGKSLQANDLARPAELDRENHRYRWVPDHHRRHHGHCSCLGRGVSAGSNRAGADTFTRLETTPKARGWPVSG